MQITEAGLDAVKECIDTKWRYKGLQDAEASKGDKQKAAMQYSQTNPLREGKTLNFNTFKKVKQMC